MDIHWAFDRFGYFLGAEAHHPSVHRFGGHDRLDLWEPGPEDAERSAAAVFRSRFALAHAFGWHWRLQDPKQGIRSEGENGFPSEEGA